MAANQAQRMAGGAWRNLAQYQPAINISGASQQAAAGFSAARKSIAA